MQVTETGAARTVAGAKVTVAGAFLTLPRTHAAAAGASLTSPTASFTAAAGTAAIGAGDATVGPAWFTATVRVHRAGYVVETCGTVSRAHQDMPLSRDLRARTAAHGDRHQHIVSYDRGVRGRP